jgi:excisionase family DNA binding protein
VGREFGGWPAIARLPPCGPLACWWHVVASLDTARERPTLDDLIHEAFGQGCRTEVVPLLAKMEARLEAKIEAGFAAIRRELQPVQYITRAEAREQLDCSMDSVDRMVADGRLRAKKVGRAVRIDRTSLHLPPENEVAALARAARAR